MPRIARKDITTHYNHVIVQGIDKEYIFDCDEYKNKYLELLKNNIKNNEEIKLLAYCIMGNHAHFLFYGKKFLEVSKIMHSINTSYAKFYNEKNERAGFVFRNRYFLQPILSRRQLYNCLIYIHNNPVKATIVKNPEEYQYSSYLDWINKKGCIDDDAYSLIYGEKNIDLEKFKLAHIRTIINDIDDIDNDVEVIEYKKIIKRYENELNLELKKIVLDDEYLIKIARELNQKSNLSVRKISKVLNINRPKLTKILQK